MQISLVIFRELLEVTLLMALISATIGQQVKNFRFYLTISAIIGFAGALMIAALTPIISSMFDGQGQEVFNSIIICITALILSYTVISMKNYSKKLKSEIALLADKVNDTALYKLSLVGIIAVNFFREGSEIVLFFYSTLMTEVWPWYTYLIGIVLGAGAAALCSLILYKGLVKISIIFNITSIMLTFVIAGLASEGVGILGRCDIIPFGSSQAWDTSWFLPEKSVAGQILHVLIGYHSSPSVLEAIVFSLTFVIIFYLSIIKNNTFYK